MRLVITGGAGFIGSHLVDHYMAAGDEVVVVDNLLSGKEENIRQHFRKPGFTFIRKDVCSLTAISGPVDIIMHFACPASPFDYIKYPFETLNVMSVGSMKMLDIAHVKKAKFILASTSEVYGDPEIHPQGETYFGNVNLMSPRAVYDEGKRFAETLTATYRRIHDLRTAIIRIFNTYGERMRPGDGRVVPTFIKQALHGQPLTIFGDGKQTRSFCYIKDMVGAISKVAAVDHDLPINLGNPAEYTVLQLADVIRRLCNSASKFCFRPLPDSDPRKRKPDITKAQRLLGWEPATPLEDGLKNVIKWFQEKE